MEVAVNVPCECAVKGVTMPRIPGCYQHLSGQKLDELIRTIQSKTRLWGAACSNADISAGAALRTSCSGKGQLSFEAQLIGPFQD